MGQSRDIKRKYHQNVAGSSLDPCVYCGGVATTIDHIQPKSLGGTNDIENLAPMCKKCNNDKGGSSVLLAMFQNDLKRRMTQKFGIGKRRIEKEAKHKKNQEEWLKKQNADVA